MYMPYPFQIVQSSRKVFMQFEYAFHNRTIFTDGSSHPKGGLGLWLGDSRGRWEGDTLVADVADFNDQTWFDRAGNFHSDALHVVERYTLRDRDHIDYEATIEDPQVFTQTLEDAHDFLSSSRGELPGAGISLLGVSAREVLPVSSIQ